MKDIKSQGKINFSPINYTHINSQLYLEKQTSSTILSRFIKELFVTILWVAILYFLVNFISIRVVVKGRSMEPNLVEGNFRTEEATDKHKRRMIKEYSIKGSKEAQKK